MLAQEEQQLVEAVEELARTTFAERASQVDRDGSFPATNVKDLQGLKVPGMGMPTETGGMGASAEARCRVVEAVAYGCGSTAVALNMHFFSADILMLNPMPNAFTTEVRKDVGGNQALMCAPGSVPTSGLDTRTSGYSAIDEGETIVINGKSGFASMSEGATYMFMVGNVERGEGAEPDIFMATPRMDSPGITNLKNWDAMGLRGTASHDIQVEDLRLPKTEATVIPRAFFEQIAQLANTLPAEVRQGRAVGALGILAIWLGLARAALDFTTDYVEHRYGGLPTVAVPGMGLRADDAWAQIGIGRMAHWVESGRVMFYHFVDSLATPYPSDREFNRQLGILVYHMRRMCEEVAMDAIKVCGAHAYVRNRPLERIYRDLTGCVAMAWKTDSMAQQVGLATLGREFIVGGPVGVGNSG